MTDTKAAEPHESGPAFRLIYRSQSLVAPDERKTSLGEIFTTARRNNKALGITGALIVSGAGFVQALEGDETAVRALYATITEDPRHEGLMIVEEGDVEARVFGRWAMAEVAEDGRPDIRLVSNAAKGVITTAGPDPSRTPEQETVLATMRAAMVHDSLTA